MKYRNNFLREVEANVEEGEWVKRCMQCGVCAGLGMLKTKRMDPMEILGGHGCEDASGLQAMLKKASEIEAAKKVKV
jgi:hypothetical protein